MDICSGMVAQQQGILSTCRSNRPPLFGLSLYAGQNTEYYISSKGGKIFTESVAGLWIFPMLPVMVDYRVPWTKGYLKNKRPYLSASIEINQLSVFVIALLLGAEFEWD
jgi:hypothetical protein